MTRASRTRRTSRRCLHQRFLLSLGLLLVALIPPLQAQPWRPPEATVQQTRQPQWPTQPPSAAPRLAQAIPAEPLPLEETAVPLLPAADYVDYVGDGSAWSWQWMPDSLMYRTYLAGVKEPRIGSVWASEKDFGPIWDTALGTRTGVLRYGSSEDGRPQGWQLDIEAAAFARVDPDGDSNPLIGTDYRVGIPMTYARGRFHCKFGYYHISSHLGDEFMLQNPGAYNRINYVRDSLLLGCGYYWADWLRQYAEVGYAAGVSGGAEPLEFQWGVEFSPLRTRFIGAPFAAVNAHLREELDFAGSTVIQVGWQFCQAENGRRFRMGLQYYGGKNEQYEFFDDSESKLGFGLWVDN